MTIATKGRTGKIAVYEQANAPFRIRDYPLRAPEPGEVLVRIRMSTICRSDIHSYQGHRPNPCPGVLGHCLLYTSPSPRDRTRSRMPSSA